MSRAKRMVYTKEGGDVSERKVIMVSKHRDNDLVYDVSKLTDSQLEYLEAALEEVEIYRNETMAEFEAVSDVKINSLWRSFKPGGIDWKE